MRGRGQLLLPTALLLLLLFTSHAGFAQTDFWQRASGPVGSVIYSLAINSRDHIFAATNGNKVVRSTDHGRSWTQIGTGLTNPVVLTLAISKYGSSEGHIFAGTSGVFRSMDNGDTWTQLNTTLGNNVVFCITVCLNGAILVGTGGSGMFRSTDMGTSWTHASAGPTDNFIHSLAASPSGHVYAGTNAGVFRSTDDGESWMLVDESLGNLSIRALAIGGRTEVYAGTFGGGVLRSTDHGERWTRADAGLTNLDVRSLVVNARGDIFAGTNGGGVFRSTDSGESWTPINSGLSGNRIWALAIDLKGYLFAGTLGGTIFRSVRPTTGKEGETNDIPLQYALKQNYPNPFNSRTTIEFSVPSPSMVLLKIYNILGEEVSTLVDRAFDAGNYRTLWDANAFASGSYFYRMQARSLVSDDTDERTFVETKNLVLLK